MQIPFRAVRVFRGSSSQFLFERREEALHEAALVLPELFDLGRLSGDELVEGGEDGGDFSLLGKRREGQSNCREIFSNVRPSLNRYEFLVNVSL